MPKVADCEWLCYAMDGCVLKYTEVVIWASYTKFYCGLGRRKCGSYILCSFIVYVLTREDRKCFPTQYHPPPNRLATSTRNDVILRALSVWPVWPIQSQLPKFVMDLVRHACFVSPRGCYRKCASVEAFSELEGTQNLHFAI